MEILNNILSLLWDFVVSFHETPFEMLASIPQYYQTDGIFLLFYLQS